MRKYHILIAAIIFIVGILSASSPIFKNIPPGVIITYFLLLFLFLLLSIKKDALFLFVLLVTIFFSGAARYDMFNAPRQNDIRNYDLYKKKNMLLRGSIASDVEKGKKKSRFMLDTNAGFVLVNVYGKEATLYQYGDVILAEGILRKPHSFGRRANFDYRKYLANKRIYAILNVKKGDFCKKTGEDSTFTATILRAIYRVRSDLEIYIKKFVNEPYDSVLIAMLLGKKSGIPSGLRDLFAKTGTLHVLAISGLHVGIIYFVLRTVFKIIRVRKNLSVALCILFLAVYAVMAGGRPSILRATAMFSILGLGDILKRKISTQNLIGLSCLVILLINPNQVFDIGFILSYIAVLSIIFLSAPLYRILSLGHPIKKRNTFWEKSSYYLLQSISVSLSVWVGLLPLLAYYFGLISPVVVIANLIAVPLLVMIMGSGILLILLGLTPGFLAVILGESAWFFLALLVKSLEILKNIPLGYFYVKPPTMAMIMIYYVAIFVLYNLPRAKKLTFSFLT